jgi:transcriptional regulator with XRE-family HTH domain
VIGREEVTLLPEQGSPTVRGRRLAGELRRLRERAGMTGDEVAQRLGWSNSKVSRIELHRIGIKQADLRMLLDLYGVKEPHRSELQALARESRQKGRLERVTAELPAKYAEHLHREADAESLSFWDPQVVPGLFQTEDYTRELMLGWQSMFVLPPSDIDRRLEARLVRLQILTRDPPPELSMVIDESVLHRRYGGSSVMRDQLEKLIDMSELPNVALHILPLDGSHPVGTGAFYHMRFPQIHEVPLPDMVTIEHMLGNYYVEDDEESHKYWVVFEQLVAGSLGVQESREFIGTAIRELWS